MPIPVDSFHAPNYEYYSMSCPTSTSCTAVGQFEDAASEWVPVVETKTGGAWGTAVAIALPVDATPTLQAGAWMSSIDCTSVGNCVAVGQYPVGAEAETKPMIATETAGIWGPATESTNLPAGAATGATEVAELSSIWCAGAGSCVATGSFLDGSSNAHTMVATETGGTWQPAIQLADPPGIVEVGGALQPLGLACADLLNCTLTGTFPSHGGNGATAYAQRESAGAWGAATPFSPGNLPFALLASVACPTASTCIAVGSATTDQNVTYPFAVTATSGKWGKATILPSPLLSPPTSGGDLNWISCGSRTVCVAAGDTYDAKQGRVPAADTWTGGKWSSAGLLTTAPSGGAAPADATLDAVHCFSAESCLAIGTSSPTFSSTAPYFAFSASLVPTRTVGAPGPPIGVHAKLSPGVAALSWAPPANDGGAAIVLFRLTATSAREPSRSCQSRVPTCRISGLARGHAYVVTVVARNAAGHMGAPAKIHIVAH